MTLSDCPYRHNGPCKGHLPNGPERDAFEAAQRLGKQGGGA